MSAKEELEFLGVPPSNVILFEIKINEIFKNKMYPVHSTA